MVILNAPSNKDELTAWHLSIVFVKLALIVLLALFKVLLYFFVFYLLSATQTEQGYNTN